MAQEIQKDVRAWPGPDGTQVARRVNAWEEAHKVVAEIEGIRAGGRALQGTYAFGQNPNWKGPGKGGGGKSSSSGGGGGQRRAERGQADQHQHGLRGGEHRGEITVTSNHDSVQNTHFSSTRPRL